MSQDTNHLGQPVGSAVPGWKPPLLPPYEPIEGRWCRVEPLDLERHTADLHAANALDVQGINWTYLPYGPFETLYGYRAWVEERCRTSDPLFYAIVELGKERAVGVASHMNIDPSNGSIEVGHISYSPLLQRTVAGTEAMHLMMRQAFELGYRRYQWKCDLLNAPSRTAAQRLGLSYEGVFRQARIVKGRNRDTAWYAAIDSEWPLLQQAFLRWLAPSNFDEQGKQHIPLSDLTRPLLKQQS